MSVISDIAGAHPRALERDFMDDHASINVVAKNLQRASRKWPKKKGPTKSVSRKQTRGKSRSAGRSKKKFILKEKSFYRDKNQKSANRGKGRQRKRDRQPRREDEGDLEESNLFSSMNEDELEASETKHKAKARLKSPSPFTKETNFILRNKKMLEGLRLKREKAKKDGRRQLNKSRNKYAHVQSKVRGHIPRSRSRNERKRSTSINMRPSPMKSPRRPSKPGGSKSKSGRRVHDDRRRAEEAQDSGRRQKSRRKMVKQNREQMEREYEAQMQKYATRKQARAREAGQRLKANYADHNTRPRKQRMGKSPHRHASPIP